MCLGFQKLTLQLFVVICLGVTTDGPFLCFRIFIMSMYRMGIDLGECCFWYARYSFLDVNSICWCIALHCVLKEYVDEYARFDTLSYHCCIETNTHCRRTDGHQSLELVN